MTDGLPSLGLQGKLVRQMHLLTEPSRRWLTVGLTGLIVAALAHCAWEESRELAQWKAAVRQHRLGQSSPIHAPLHDCGHESGCICRGATIVHAVDASHLNSFGEVSWMLNLLQSTAATTPVGTLELQSFDDSFFTAAPISGRQLRALYASLLI